MKVESKFNIRDTIFFMDMSLPTKGIITGITIFTGEDKKVTGEWYLTKDGQFSISYHVEQENSCYITVNENNVYATKEELKKALFDSL